MRVLVCGGRNYADGAKVYSVLDELRPSIIAQGGASGADHLAKTWAEARGVSRAEYKAAWHEHGKAAGPIRNQLMLDEFEPDLVLAFAGGRGTADMVRRATAAGVKVQHVA